MTNRILDFSSSPARIRTALEQLVVERENLPDITIPLADIAVVVASHRQITFTLPALAALAGHGASVVVCDERSLPVAVQTPLPRHSLQGARAHLQAGAGQPRLKQCWKQLVQAKIRGQADVLEKARGGDSGLRVLASEVRSGDPENVEARAARIFWGNLFGDVPFRRDADGDGPNPLLNYGYAILRAATARTLCASGWYPALGLHHHNQYNPLALADDFMEPFRPLVDWAVVQLVWRHGVDPGLTPEIKSSLIQPILGRIQWGEESRTIFDGLFKVAASYASVLSGGTARLELPDTLFVDE